MKQLIKYKKSITRIRESLDSLFALRGFVVDLLLFLTRLSSSFSNLVLILGRRIGQNRFRTIHRFRLWWRHDIVCLFAFRVRAVRFRRKETSDVLKDEKNWGLPINDVKFLKLSQNRFIIRDIYKTNDIKNVISYIWQKVTTSWSGGTPLDETD